MTDYIDEGIPDRMMPYISQYDHWVPVSDRIHRRKTEARMYTKSGAMAIVAAPEIDETVLQGERYVAIACPFTYNRVRSSQRAGGGEDLGAGFPDRAACVGRRAEPPSAASDPSITLSHATIRK